MDYLHLEGVDSIAVSMLIDILVELTNTAFVNSTNIPTNIETAVLSTTYSNLKLGWPHLILSSKQTFEVCTVSQIIDINMFCEEDDLYCSV